MIKLRSDFQILKWTGWVVYSRHNPPTPTLENLIPTTNPSLTNCIEERRHKGVSFLILKFRLCLYDSWSRRNNHLDVTQNRNIKQKSDLSVLFILYMGLCKYIHRSQFSKQEAMLFIFELGSEKKSDERPSSSHSGVEKLWWVLRLLFRGRHLHCSLFLGLNPGQALIEPGRSSQKDHVLLISRFGYLSLSLKNPRGELSGRFGSGIVYKPLCHT